jgi:dihydroflavonol-4-reductase
MASEPLQVCLTGGTGFLGRHVARALVDAGVAVRCLSRSGGAPFEHALLTAASVDVLDLGALTDAARGCAAMLHGAGLVSNRSKDARKVFDLHVTGTENAVNACKAAGVPRLVLISTSGTIAVGTDPDKVYTEDDPYAVQTTARWPYYRTKLFAEELALKAHGDGLTVVSVNPSLLLGPGDDEDGASTHSVRTFLEDGVPLSPPGGLAFVDVRDAADGVLRALRRGRGGQRYLLNGANLTFHDFFERLARISGKPGPKGRMPQLLRGALSWLPGTGPLTLGVGPVLSRNELDLASHFWYCDARLARDELGWRPRDPLQTLSDTVRDLEARAAW